MLLVFLNHLVISCSLTHCVYGSDAKLYWKVDWENTEELQTRFVSICLKKWGGGVLFRLVSSVIFNKHSHLGNFHLSDFTDVWPDLFPSEQEKSV